MGRWGWMGDSMLPPPPQCAYALHISLSFYWFTDNCVYVYITVTRSGIYAYHVLSRNRGIEQEVIDLIITPFFGVVCYYFTVCLFSPSLPVLSLSSFHCLSCETDDFWEHCGIAYARD